MAFWGAEVRSGKPRTLTSLSDKGRFHLTQATLGLSAYDEDENKGSFVQCNVGDNPGVLICSLCPGKTNMCSLNLEFDEDEEVVFSVLGPNSIHLCGFFEERNPDEYGEDITEENCEDEEEEDEDMSDDDDGFIVADDDSEEEEDNMIVSPGVVPNSGVRIEEIVDELEAEKEGTQKAEKKDKIKKKKEEDKQNDQEEQKTMLSEGNGIEKEEGNGEGNKVNGDNNKVSVNGKRKKKSKGNVEGEADEEPPSKKQATEDAVIGVTEAAKVKTSKKKKKSKKKAKNKADAPEE